jgi:hypothetical protein
MVGVPLARSYTYALPSEGTTKEHVNRGGDELVETDFA